MIPIAYALIADWFGPRRRPAATSRSAVPTSPPGTGLVSGRPLVVIRFDRSDVKYEQALYQAANAAVLEKAGGAVRILQKEFTPDQFIIDLCRLFQFDLVVKALR